MTIGSDSRFITVVPYSGGDVTQGGDLGGSSLAAGTQNFEFRGFGHMSQIIAKLVAGGVTGGSDTLDCKLQYYIAGTWVDVVGGGFTQLTAGGSQVLYIIRTALVGWTDQMRVVTVVGAGATATGVVLEVSGACV